MQKQRQSIHTKVNQKSKKDSVMAKDREAKKHSVGSRFKEIYKIFDQFG